MTSRTIHTGRVSRRHLIKSGFWAAAAVAGRGVFAQIPQGASPAGDFILRNGKFVDGRGVVASVLTVKNGRIVNVGQAMPLGPGAKTVDLRGRTVVPGFFDAHVHYTRAAMNPGYEARRIERAFSISELQEAISRRAESVPSGKFIIERYGFAGECCDRRTSDLAGGRRQVAWNGGTQRACQ